MLSYVFLGCFLTIAICLSVSTAYYRYQILHVFVNIKTFKNVIFASKINCEKPNHHLKQAKAEAVGGAEEGEKEGGGEGVKEKAREFTQVRKKGLEKKR